MLWSIISYVSVTYLVIWVLLLPGFIIKFSLNPPFYVEGAAGIVRASYSVWLASVLYPIHFYYAAKNSRSEPKSIANPLIDIGDFDD